MANTEHGNSNGHPKFCNAAECGCKATIKQGEQPWRTCADNQQRDNEAAQHPTHATEIHTDFRCERPTMRESITKSDWLAAQGCTSQAWFALRSKRAVPSEAGLFRMEQGREVGLLAQDFFQAELLFRNLA
jgi:hypothetical protein